jgi:phosphoribosylanthranilate isomerase
LVWIKFCGFCDTESARVAVELGVDAIGLNFVSRSKRRVSPALAREIAEPLRGRVELVGVVESLSLQEAAQLRDDLKLDSIQLHGAGDTTEWKQLPEWVYLAVGVTGSVDAGRLLTHPGARLLVDACVNGSTGGTGMVFDWSLVRDASRTRPIIVAGGLTPENVGLALSVTRAAGVDVASGVEEPARPGFKSSELMRRFIENVRGAE